MMVLFVPSWNTIQNFHFILANKIFNFWMGSFKSIADYWATKQWDMLELACVTPSFQFYLHFNALRWSNLQFFLFEHLMQCRLLLLAQQNEIKKLLCAHFKCLSTWLPISFTASFIIEIFSTKKLKGKIKSFRSFNLLFVLNMVWIRASEYPSGGACFQLRLSYSPAAQFFLFLVQWTDCHLAGALGFIRILIYKVFSSFFSWSINISIFSL